MKRYATTTTTPPWGTWGRTLKSNVYDAIAAAGEVGANRKEIADKTNLNVGRVSSYLAELKRDGLVKRLGDQVDPSTLNAEDAVLYALTVMEGALVAKASALAAKAPDKKVPADLEKGFLRYSKIKALWLGAKTGGEERSALKRTVIDLVNMLF